MWLTAREECAAVACRKDSRPAPMQSTQLDGVRTTGQ